MNRQLIENKLRKHCPLATDAFITAAADALIDIDPPLRENVRQWIEDIPFTDIWIHERYCLRTVMALRHNKDILEALLALDRYARHPNSTTEHLLREVRR